MMMRKRADLTEAMDDPQCDTQKLHRTLRQFERLNRFFSSYRKLLTEWVLDDMARTPDRPRRLLDVGCGGGDIAEWAVNEARRRQLPLTVRAVDSHPKVFAYVSKRLEQYPQIECRCENALDPETWRDCDYVFGNHFLHHLPDSVIRGLLEQLGRSPVRRFIFDDLRRSPFSYACWSVIAPVLFPGGFATGDGRLSIRRGFRKDELQRLGSFRVATTVPFRIAVIAEDCRQRG
jgi:2-polyprenyl-3-methyl-5-hydroxy-6-metoxy-1,4-benzoquinol methylase